jgi:hypothetical protein
VIQAYPLHWPEGWKRTTFRSKSKFGIQGFGRARDLLLKEVKLLGGTSVILSTNIALRLDGLPYANEREPQDPGVAVYFTYNKRMMCFACDRWRTVKENAYSIAKSIEAMRGIERWGSSQIMERTFTGFAALPEKTSRHWREVLDTPYSNVTREQIETRYRTLAKTRHPDVGGSEAAMAELNAARTEALQEIAQ